ncbi:hypothetical protein GIB67_007688 [Kingdonia uniflora]|uniref:Aminotransferase-like plant mobile domain-containing protein n=1 Tax=Kingdonia uniflora TaxID=39325 RepID=A0A7J7N1Q9_9MAGN|nr:hypothetical protein GIB67_007688 [Kingdonia uniflora]
MPEGEPHPSTMPRFRGTKDPERAVTLSRSGRKKKRVEFEDVQPQSIPNPTQENFPWRCITQFLDGVTHINYTEKELTNRDSMRVHGTFTTVIKVWKEISTILPVWDAVVNIFGQFMDIRLGKSDNRLIEALIECWWPTTHTFLFPCAEIGVTPLNFTMLSSLSIGRYPTKVSYDDTWSILSNARQLLPNIDYSHINSKNVSISHLRTYLTIAADREDDITIVRTFILFMMGCGSKRPTTPSHLDILRSWPIWTRLPNMTRVLLFLLPCTMVWISQSRPRVPSLDLSNFLRISSTSIVELVTLLLRKMLSSWPIRISEHDLQLRRGRDVRVVQRPPEGGARTRQRGSGLRTRGCGTIHKGRGTGDDS